MNKNEVIGVKDAILITLLTAVMLIIQSVTLLPFAVNLKLTLWFAMGTELLLCGIVYILMIAKSPKTGTLLLYGIIIAVYYFFVNGLLPISLMLIGDGLLCELILLRGGYKSKIRITTAYAVFGVLLMLAPNILLLLQKESMIQAMLAQGLEQTYLDTMFSVYSLKNIAIGAGITALGACSGSFIGYKVLEKYFIPAGIVRI